MLSLLGWLCDSLPEYKLKLLRKGLMHLLTSLLHKRCKAETKNSAYNMAALELALKISEFYLLLSRGCVASMEALLFHTVIIDITELCSVSNHFMFGFSPAARAALSKLTLHRDLIGQASALNAEYLSGLYLGQFGDQCYDIRLPQAGYEVELYDTENPSEDILILDELGECVDFRWWLRKETNGEGDWMDIHVTHVVDGQHFWAWIKGEQAARDIKFIQETLKNWPDQQKSCVGRYPTVGAYVCIPNDPELPAYRAQIVSSDEEDSLSIFAVDYGFVKTVPNKDLFYLTPEMNLRLKPLAVLCELKGERFMGRAPFISPIVTKCMYMEFGYFSFAGVMPPPFSTACLKNFLGVLQNLATFDLASKSI